MASDRLLDAVNDQLELLEKTYGKEMLEGLEATGEDWGEPVVWGGPGDFVGGQIVRLSKATVQDDDDEEREVPVVGLIDPDGETKWSMFLSPYELRDLHRRYNLEIGDTLLVICTEEIDVDRPSPMRKFAVSCCNSDGRVKEALPREMDDAVSF